MSKLKSKIPAYRNHNLYIWLITELRTLVDNALAVSTQYDWINNDDDKRFLMELIDRDIVRIANHAAKQTKD